MLMHIWMAMAAAGAAPTPAQALDAALVDQATTELTAAEAQFADARSNLSERERALDEARLESTRATAAAKGKGAADAALAKAEATAKVALETAQKAITGPGEAADKLTIAAGRLTAATADLTRAKCYQEGVEGDNEESACPAQGAVAALRLQLRLAEEDMAAAALDHARTRAEARWYEYGTWSENDKARVRATAAAALVADLSRELDGARERLDRAARGESRSLSGTERIYISGDGQGAIASTDGIISGGGGIGLRVISRLDRLSLRLGASASTPVGGETGYGSTFAAWVLNPNSSGTAARVDYRFSIVGTGGVGALSRLDRRETSPGIHTFGAHLTAAGAHSTWDVGAGGFSVWTAQLSPLLSYEYNFSALLEEQELYLDVEAGWTMRAVAGDITQAAALLAAPGDGPLGDTVFWGPELRAAVGVNDGEFWLDVTYLHNPAYEGEGPEVHAAPGVTGWQLVSGVTIYGDLFKIYDAKGR